MTITTENIERLNQIGQQTTDLLSVLLHQNIFISSSDSKKTIARKIDRLKVLREYFVKNIDIDTLPTDEDELIFFDLISNITEQIEVYEIIIGRKNIETLRRIGKRFGEKHKEPIALAH